MRPKLIQQYKSTAREYFDGKKCGNSGKHRLHKLPTTTTVLTCKTTSIEDAAPQTHSHTSTLLLGYEASRRDAKTEKKGKPSRKGHGRQTQK